MQTIRLIGLTFVLFVLWLADDKAGQSSPKYNRGSDLDTLGQLSISIVENN